MSIQILNATNLQLATCRQTPTNKLTLEDRDGDLVGHLGLGGVPLGVGPALQHLGGDGVAPLVQLLHVVEGIEHQQSVLELISRQLGHGGVGIAEEGDEGGHCGAEDRRNANEKKKKNGELEAAPCKEQSIPPTQNRQ